MQRHLLAAVAAMLVLLPPPPAAGQFREFLELFQPRQKPKPRHRPSTPVPLPPIQPMPKAETSIAPDAATEGGAANAEAVPVAVPLPPMSPRPKSGEPMSPRPQGGEPAVPPAEAGRDGAETAVGESKDVIKDQWSEAEVMDALRACVDRLGPIVAEVEALTPIRAGRCGSAAPLKLLRLGKDPGVEIAPAATLNCDMVLALDQWIKTAVQPVARRMLGSPIVRLRNATSYSCRNRNDADEAPLSEHAFANALDIAGFVTEDGRHVEPLKNWGLTEREIEAARRVAELVQEAAERAQATSQETEETPPQAARDTGNEGKRSLRVGPVPLPPLRKEAKMATAARSLATPPLPPDPGPTPEREFLRRVHKDACGLFGTVLGPEANDAHRDHFHLDLAARRRGAFCE